MDVGHEIFSIQSSDPHNPDYLVMGVVFDEEDLDYLGVDRTSWDFSEDYLGEDEFNKAINQWGDLTLLREFYTENIDFLSDPYWQGITRNRFVEDVKSSLPDIIRDFGESCKNKALYDHFEPLGKEDAHRREENVNYHSKHKILKLKAKYGSIANRIAFRLYAIEVDETCYIITGGAIKIVEEMRQAPNTSLELRKIEYVEHALSDAGIYSKAELLKYINY